tara:strand:- start:238 stop:573 length:336 start_codon:yes stop_codon:yes gene_type:complete
MKNNKLIAEFMGLRDGDKYFSPTLEDAESVGLGMHVYPDEMRFHISWDWLMPVVEEIECLIDPNGNAYRFTIDMCNAQIEETNIKILGGAFKLDSTYKAVVEFIKKYNDKQ